MEPHFPRISVVIPSLDQGRYVEEAVRSVADQPVPVEVIVMDPGSTDRSREILIRLAEEYGETVRLVFEPDQGQSDAVNRGMALARAPLLGWLNADDRLRPGALRTVIDRLDPGPPCWLYGQAGMIDGEGKGISSLVVTYKNWRGRRFSYRKLLTENFIPQMAVFWSRPLWDVAGGLDPARHLDMDYDLWFRFARVTDPIVVEQTLADFRVHPDAKGSRLAGRQLEDAYETARRHAEGVPGGALSLLTHRLFSLRTRILYRIIKPKGEG